MSFNCQKCKKHFDGSPNTIITKIRRKVYPKRVDENDNIIDAGGTGWEIVEEQQICPSCFVERMDGNR